MFACVSKDKVLAVHSSTKNHYLTTNLWHFMTNWNFKLSVLVKLVDFWILDFQMKLLENNFQRVSEFFLTRCPKKLLA